MGFNSGFKGLNVAVPFFADCWSLSYSVEAFRRNVLPPRI